MADRAVILLSGGLDSTTTLAVARAEGYECYALSFDYGQRHARELESARRVAAAFEVRRHLVLRLDLRAIGGSALTDDIPVPKARSDAAIGAGIPVTYVPARNTIFLGYALGWAEVLDAQDLFLGVNALDYSGYPDCRPEFVEAFERLANLATKAGVEGTRRFRVHTPLDRRSARRRSCCAPGSSAWTSRSPGPATSPARTAGRAAPATPAFSAPGASPRRISRIRSRRRDRPRGLPPRAYLVAPRPSRRPARGALDLARGPCRRGRASSRAAQ